MPYFLYKITDAKEFELLGDFDGYRDAREKAREVRGTLASDDATVVKMIFAKNPDEAVRLLSEERTPRPLGEDA